MTLRKLHKSTAVLLVVFIILHFATHLAGLFGIAAYDRVQAAFRLLYRNPIVEPILLVAFITQIIGGAVLLLGQYRRGLRGRWAKLQAASGAAFLFFIIQHISAMALARWGDGLNTTFYWPAAGMNGAPFVWYFFPYYFLGVTALFLHIACALRLVLMRSQRHHLALPALWGLTALGLALAITINLMLIGTFYPIVLPEIWVDYLRGFLPFYGR
ncbi:MAG: hypothetical protein WD046_00715 [Paracoccaceae bacterium]